MKTYLAAGILMLCGIVPAFSAELTITVFENGTGSNLFDGTTTTPLPFSLIADPGPGGQGSVLTFDLLNPPNLQFGDVFIGTPGEGLSDIIRFNPATGCDSDTCTYPASLLFYSSNVEGLSSLADNNPPSSSYANTTSIVEGATYTPDPGQPGYVSGATVHYVFNSDEPAGTPEPATAWLLVSGLGLAGFVRRRRLANQ